MKLTVAIPTYKRPEFLDRCIRSILASARGQDVEVLVMDDSMDATNAPVLAGFADRPEVRVVKNARNLGIDANICACVENAAGEYVWLIGEDDLMRPQSIARIMPLLDKGYPFVFANYSYITADQRLVLRATSVDVPSDAMLFDTFYDSLLWSAGFIGGCVIRRTDFLATDYKRFIGTYYAHVAGISLASRGRTIGLLAEPQVGNRVGDASTFTWAAESFGVFQGWRRLLDMLRPTFGDAHHARAYASHKAAHGYLGLKFLVIKRADGLLAWGPVKKLLADDVSTKERLMVLATFALVPRWFARQLRASYARMRRQTLAPFSLD